MSSSAKPLHTVAWLDRPTVTELLPALEAPAHRVAWTDVPGHGYRHFGVGAALLGFDRPAAPTSAEAQAIVDDLLHLYGAPDSAGWAELATLLTARPLLFLGYAENVADQFQRKLPPLPRLRRR